MNVKLIAIAALGKNREIGLQDALPWKMPEEYEHFKRTIKDNYVLIGRKNYELHGGDVEGAYPLVLSRDKTFSSKNALVFQDVLEVISYLEDAEIGKVYVMGGAEIYKLALPYVSEFLWSEIDYSGPADKYFPDFSMFDWTKISEERHQGWTLKTLIKIPQKPY